MLARRVQGLLTPLDVTLDDSWGLDHGTWSVLKHAYPAADIPVVQLSIDETKPASFHFDVGTKLAPLREEGVLIVGSGNLVHNLHAYAWGRHSQDPYDWAVRFENVARDAMLAGDFSPLVNYEALGPDALLSIPTPDHYLPLLYVLACHRKGESIRFPVEGVDGGSISMRRGAASRETADARRRTNSAARWCAPLGSRSARLRVELVTSKTPTQVLRQ